MEYEKLTLNELRNIAKEEGIKGISGLKKSDLIELLNRKQEDLKKELKEDTTKEQTKEQKKEVSVKNEKNTTYSTTENIQAGEEDKNTESSKPVYWAVKEEPSKDETARRLVYQKSIEQGRKI